MRYVMELIEHNGCAGANRVEPFQGASLDLDGPVDVTNAVQHDGRQFTFSHTAQFPEQLNYCYREKVQGEPSDWAKERAQ